MRGSLMVRFRLIIASDAGEEALVTAASGTDIVEIDIRAAGKQEIPVPDERPEVREPALVETNAPSPDKTRESPIPDDSPR